MILFPTVSVFSELLNSLFLYKTGPPSPFHVHLGHWVNASTLLWLESLDCSQRHLSEKVPKILLDKTSNFFEAGERLVNHTPFNEGCCPL